MIIKRLFDLMEEANKFNALIGRKETTIVFVPDDTRFPRMKSANFTDFQKMIRREMPTAAETIICADLEQEETAEKNWYHFEGADGIAFDIGIVKIKVANSMLRYYGINLEVIPC